MVSMVVRLRGVSRQRADHLIGGIWRRAAVGRRTPYRAWSAVLSGSERSARRRETTREAIVAALEVAGFESGCATLDKSRILPVQPPRSVESCV